MTVYAKATKSSGPIFHGRVQTIATLNSDLSIGRVISQDPIPDSLTLCNGCNENMAEGYLVYLSKANLKANRPYDYYCQECLDRYFPKAQKVK